VEPTLWNLVRYSCSTLCTYPLVRAGKPQAITTYAMATLQMEVEGLVFLQAALQLWAKLKAMLQMQVEGLVPLRAALQLWARHVAPRHQAQRRGRRGCNPDNEVGSSLCWAWSFRQVALCHRGLELGVDCSLSVITGGPNAVGMQQATSMSELCCGKMNHFCETR